MGGSVSSLHHKPEDGDKSLAPLVILDHQPDTVPNATNVKTTAISTSAARKELLLQQFINPPRDVQILRRDNKVQDILKIITSL